METKKKNTVQSSIKTYDHPYLRDAWVPNYDEYEVTDLNNLYIRDGKCKNITIDGWWIDAGTPDRIIDLEEKLT